MKIFNISFTILFALFALLQYNDPDPYLWIPIYGYATIVCIMNVRNKYDLLAHIGGVVFCSLFGLKLMFLKDGVFEWATKYHAENLVQSMKDTKPWVENTREFGGLLIIIIVLLVNMIYYKKAGAN